MEQEKKRVGRPSIYKGINKNHLRKLAQAGWTDEKIADFFGITREVLSRWKNKYPDFAQKMADWKDEADSKVERSLYERACGYSHKEEQLFCHKGEIIRAETTKYYPPDPVAIIFWLTNRKNHDWKRTRQEVSSDPLTVKVLNLIKQNGNGHHRNSDLKDDMSKITVDSTVNIERGGLKVVE